jgi:hypothetical protein
METNLAESGVIGPFDFAKIDGENHRIKPQYWQELMDKGAELDINVRDLNTIIPLG